MSGSPLARAADALARASARWVPDSLSIACLLVVFVALLGVTVGGATPVQLVDAWGNSFWELLPFSMQMVVIIFAGYIVAVAPPVAWVLERVSRIPRSPRQAVAMTAFVSMAVCWLNWGVGLITAAMLVRTMARQHPAADYRLLVAMAYVGMGTTWHAGLSGSVPLLLATPGNFVIKDGLLPGPVPLAQTVFTPFNLALMLLVVVVIVALAALLHPPPERTVGAPPDVLAEGDRALQVERPVDPTPAERLMHSPGLNQVVAALGLAWIALRLVPWRLQLTLDTVNLFFLCLGLLLHRNPAAVLKAAEEASRALHGVVLQFPLYAGIAGIIKGTQLDDLLASAFLGVATERTFPLIVFAYSAVLDYFVSSGGGKWALEAAYVLKAGAALGVPATKTAMAYAYGDMATNIVQPFWAIPLLSVARLEFRDILGFEIVAFSVYVMMMSVALLL
jgi:short-chain fatty acids transporter